MVFVAWQPPDPEGNRVPAFFYQGKHMKVIVAP